MKTKTQTNRLPYPWLFQVNKLQWIMMVCTGFNYLIQLIEVNSKGQHKRISLWWLRYHIVTLRYILTPEKEIENVRRERSLYKY